MELVLAVLGSSVLTALITYSLSRPKMMADINFANASADDKTVQMALAFANAADKKAKDIEIKMQEFQTDFRKLQVKLDTLSREHIALLRYTADCRSVIASFAPDHPILAKMPESSR